MNIFVTSESPRECAMMLDDLRLNKMIVESAQMLSTAHHLMSSNPDPALYKPTHRNHPCNIWARMSRGNYAWLYDWFFFMGSERHSRTGRYHATFVKLKYVLLIHLMVLLTLTAQLLRTAACIKTSRLLMPTVRLCRISGITISVCQNGLMLVRQNGDKYENY